MAHSNAVCLSQLFSAAEGGGQHKRRGTGKVKICDKRVNNPELITGIDEDVCGTLNK